MLPITKSDPFTKQTILLQSPTSLGFKAKKTWLIQHERWKQKPPFNLNLETKTTFRSVDYARITDPGYIDAGMLRLPGDYLYKIAYNKAYGKLQDAINSNTSQLGANLGELGRTIETINNRSVSILNFTKRLLKRKRFKWRNPAGLFIEYRWVYEATAKDLYSAVMFLEKFEPSTHVEGKGVARESGQTYLKQNHPKGGADFQWTKEKANARIISDVKVSNPNLYWASQMGLTNPAAIAWELTKFSWLADWFFSLGEVLNAWDDRLGLSFSNPCYVNRREMLSGQTMRWYEPSLDDYTMREWAGKTVLYERRNTLGGGPYLVARQIKSPSLVRGATAIALLSQMLGGKH